MIITIADMLLLLVCQVINSLCVCIPACVYMHVYVYEYVLCVHMWVCVHACHV